MMKNKEPDVWLILARVEVVGDNSSHLSIGSSALIQCFIPETVIESALARTSALLSAEGMRRTDVLSCTRFDGGTPFDKDTPEFVRRDVLNARSTGKPCTGTVFMSKESASFQQHT